MPDWTAFGAVAGLVLVLVLGLARATTGRATESPPRRTSLDQSAGIDGSDRPDHSDDAVKGGGCPPAAAQDATPPPNPEQAREQDEPLAGVDAGTDLPGIDGISTPALVANTLLTHGGLCLVLVGAAVLTGVPAASMGIEVTAASSGLDAAGAGLALGAALAGANLAVAASADRLGLESNEALRGALAPDSATGWMLLLLVVLPLVAGFEELLFRGVLIGAATVATGLSPWAFVVPSSIAFALGHGIQGRGGIVVTGLLGAVLGAAFVLSGSLLLVVIAHYVVNAVEFLLKEHLDVEIDGRLGG